MSGGAVVGSVVYVLFSSPMSLTAMTCPHVEREFVAYFLCA